MDLLCPQQNNSRARQQWWVITAEFL